MILVWSATSPESGQFSSAVMRTDAGELEQRFAELRSAGEGYIEVAFPAVESPQLCLSFRDDQAVLQMLSDPEKSSLLVGDGSVSESRLIEVPFMEHAASFSGDFVMTLDRAWGAVRKFIQTDGDVNVGEWYEL